MTDIRKRLREPPFGTETSERNIMSAAADEIERLDAENEQLRRALKHAAGILSDLEHHWLGPDFWPEIRDALNIQELGRK